jgi:hypothetical protein
MGVPVAVGGNQTTVGVGVSVGASVIVGVGGISVEGMQDARAQMAKVQISENTHRLTCQIIDLPTC